jgi:hypothetical protein
MLATSVCNGPKEKFCEETQAASESKVIQKLGMVVSECNPSSAATERLGRGAISSKAAWTYILRHYLKKSTRTGGMVQEVEHLPSKLEALC